MTARRMADKGNLGAGRIPRLRLFAALCLVAISVYGCAWSPVKPYAGSAPPHQNLYVIVSDWHSEIGIPADALPWPLASLRKMSPKARYFVFGWGQRDYYMARQPGLRDLVKAVLPSPSVVLVIPLTQPPTAFFTAGSSVFRIPVAQEGIDRLALFLWGYFAKDVQHLPRRVGDGPYPGSSFYASGATYSPFNTCNSWTAAALHVSGLPVSATGVVFAYQVVDEVRHPRQASGAAVTLTPLPPK